VVRETDELRQKDEIRRGTWHDGRLDCVAGNGIMSELGIGDELFGDKDGVEPLHCSDRSPKQKVQDGVHRKRRAAEDVEAVASLPIVVIRNFSVKLGSSREGLLVVLAEWAATLIENQVGDWLYPHVLTTNLLVDRTCHRH
jgi:hypothetical protein